MCSGVPLLVKWGRGECGFCVRSMFCRTSNQCCQLKDTHYSKCHYKLLKIQTHSCRFTMKIQCYLVIQIDTQMIFKDRINKARF